ncbi:MAG: transglutaminase family protein [Actinomycetota bacterium]
MAGDDTRPVRDEDLAPAHFVDSDHPAVVGFARRAIDDAGATTERERAVALFLRVRDGYRYDPYDTSRDPDDYRASTVVDSTSNWCVPKSVLLTAAARASGIPARLGYADVRNHLTSEKLMATMGTDLFAWHGYSELHLDGRWLKASSAFNIELCERFGTKVLDFDGTADALMHPYDEAGNRHMEYVRQRGSYADLPLDDIFATFDELYRSELFADAHDPAFHGDDGT